jgi:hypothetical protein
MRALLGGSKRFGWFFRCGGAVIVLGIVAASLGSAHAGTSTKFYGASVQRTPASCASGACFKLTLTNDVKSSQTLGSANFNAPSGWSVSVGSTQDVTASGHRWHVIADGSNVVKFRAFSSKDSLAPGQIVTANVGTTVRCDLSSNVARWTTEAKQSNDFSGQPGNDFQLTAADLTPLGSFSIPVATRITGHLLTQSAIANDTCGQPKTAYNGGATVTLAHTLLTGATFAPASGLSWSTNGVGTVDITPAVSETGNTLTVSDSTTGVTSTSNPFNVVDVLCPSGSCHGQDALANPLTLADSSVPSGASLGLGFNSTLSFSCSSVTTQVGSFTNIDPSSYPVDSNGNPIPFTVTLTYSKSVSGSRPASSFVVCLSETMGGASWQSLLACATTPVAPCVLSKKRTNLGDLQVVLYLDPTDPWIGTG